MTTGARLGRLGVPAAPRESPSSRPAACCTLRSPSFAVPCVHGALIGTNVLIKMKITMHERLDG